MNKCHDENDQRDRNEHEHGKRKQDVRTYAHTDTNRPYSIRLSRSTLP